MDKSNRFVLFLLASCPLYSKKSNLATINTAYPCVERVESTRPNKKVSGQHHPVPEAESSALGLLGGPVILLQIEYYYCLSDLIRRRERNKQMAHLMDEAKGKLVSFSPHPTSSSAFLRVP